MFMQHHEPECHTEKLVHCPQCQGHSEDLYNPNMTNSSMSSRLLVLCNQTQLVVKHHKLECPVEKLDYCIQGQGNSERLIISVNVCPDDIF